MYTTNVCGTNHIHIHVCTHHSVTTRHVHDTVQWTCSNAHLYVYHTVLICMTAVTLELYTGTLGSTLPTHFQVHKYVILGTVQFIYFKCPDWGSSPVIEFPVSPSLPSLLSSPWLSCACCCLGLLGGPRR